MFAGMGLRDRRVRVCLSKTMWAFGAQEWFSRAVCGVRQRPRGSSVGVVSVWVLIITLASTVCTLLTVSLLPEYFEAAWLISSMVCHALRPSSFFVGWDWKSLTCDCNFRKLDHSSSDREWFCRRSRRRKTTRTVLGRTFG